MAFRFADGNAIEQILELAAGYGIGGATSTALEPLLQDLRSKLWSLDPTLPTDADTLALLLRMGKIGDGAALAEAAKSGVGSDSFARYLQAIQTVPDAGVLIQLTQRGDITPSELATHFERAGIDPRYSAMLTDLVRNPLSPQDAAMARQQGFIDDVTSYAYAKMGGVTQADSDLMFELSGLPPGPEQMIELLRRGEVSEDDVRQSIVEGHIKLKYVDDVLKLQWQPLSASVAAEALIRQRITQDEAIAIAAKNGLQADDFLMWSNMLGRPIAIGEALTLYRRGEFSVADVTDAVARSDVRTEYAPDVLKLAVVYPTLFQIMRAVGAGQVTDTLAASTLAKLGYPQEWVTALVGSAKSTKTAATKKLAASAIDELYESGLETRDWADAQLQGLGYSAEEAEWHMELLDAQLLIAALRSALNLIHRTYVTRKIDEPQASDELAQLGVRPDAADLLLQQWTNERAETILVLTNAQIGRALKLNLINEDDAIARWVANGYSQADASILAGIAGHPASGPNPTAP